MFPFENWTAASRYRFHGSRKKKINEKFSNSRKFLNNPCARNMWGIVVIDDIGNLLNGLINNQICVILTVNMTLPFKYVT